MIVFKKLLLLSLILICTGCTTKEHFQEEMYKGLKARERLINPEYENNLNLNHEKDIDYKEYKYQIEQSNF